MIKEFWKPLYLLLNFLLALYNWPDKFDLKKSSS